MLLFIFWFYVYHVEIETFDTIVTLLMADSAAHSLTPSSHEIHVKNKSAGRLVTWLEKDANET